MLLPTSPLRSLSLLPPLLRSHSSMRSHSSLRAPVFISQRIGAFKVRKSTVLLGHPNNHDDDTKHPHVATEIVEIDESDQNSHVATAGHVRRSHSELKRKLMEMFLPRGFPSSVASNYGRYSLWHFVHLASGTVTGVLSMQSLLFAIGLGAGSIPMAAALNWVIKDGLGQLGGVMYTGMVNNRFDSDPKRHRTVSGLALQGATFIEILTPLFPKSFLFLASVSNVGKNISWLAASATRAQIHSTLCSLDNLGDLTGKAGSQSTAASLAGTGLGIMVSAAVGTDFSGVLMMYIPFAAISLHALYMSNVAVILKTLNGQRADLLIQGYLDACERAAKGGIQSFCDERTPAWPLPEVLSPKQVSEKEVFVVRSRSACRVPLCLEPSLDDVLRITPERDVTSLLHQISPSGSQSYLLLPGHFTPRRFRMKGVVPDLQKSTLSVGLWFLDKASEIEVVRGFFHAGVLRRLVEERGSFNVADDFATTQRFVDAHFPHFQESLIRAGWHIEHHFLAEDQARVSVSSKER